MPWNPFKKTDEPEKKDGEQSKSEVDQLVEKLGVSFEERLKPLREGFESLKTEWDGIKAAAAKEPEPNNNGGGGDELTEEQKAAKDRTALLALTVQTNARITESEIISEISANWSHLIPEIRSYFQSTPIQRKAQADYAEFCRNIKDMVVGKAAQKAGLRFDGKNQRFFLEDASAKTGGAESPLNDPDLGWTDPNTGKSISASEQLAKLGIKPEEFVESQKRGIV
jgi:hypothetical protein